MAPTRQKKRKSTESAGSVDTQSFPAPPQLIPTKVQSPTRTPTSRSPIRKQQVGITLGQKQALIDNLQLEITERARKLRAQYMMQAQGLRTRIEIRVNRIPMALRRAKMGDLLAKHSGTTSKDGPSRILLVKPHSPMKNLSQREQSRASPSPQRPAKRHSDEISIAVDKENEEVENSKKRMKGAPQPPDRTTSRINIKADQVLSPRSANSRTYPKSPIRTASPTGKSLLARPISPLKATAPDVTGGAASILTNMLENAKPTRGDATRKVTEASVVAGVGRAKRAPAMAPSAKVVRGRVASDTSNDSGSTVIRKNATVAMKAAVPAKRTMMSTIKGMGGGGAAKKGAVPKAAATATGGRVLRKRN
ncbi:Borealin N terminal-domain-containing protein [Calycina marina]|uniref:Borealin N terminal-domain-containing protein n=1 Tax=Calycina marina TaxID=1763456 RepID=A0A9P7Z1C3_9HELO|nr:Borealin N terminal-domain-containing protein [Calycina marina]